MVMIFNAEKKLIFLHLFYRDKEIGSIVEGPIKKEVMCWCIKMQVWRKEKQRLSR